jgi:signal transduction histidine kinase
MVVQNYDYDQSISEVHKRVLETISPQISLSIKRKQYEQLLKASEKELRISNEAKDRFFNIIAHDLKNPFNAIIGFSSLLTEEWNEFDEDDKISMVTSIRASSESAYELLMNLLEWSRLKVGKISYEPEFIDYTSLIRLNVSLLKGAAEKKNIKLNIQGVCHKMVYADPNMIKTVILNLITNAIKFTPVNGAITIECQQRTDMPGMLILAVKDTGVGIPESELSQLFSLRKAASTEGTDGETGTGLGLLLSSEFIEKNKGKIWVESHQDGLERNPGSTFYIALPVRPL